MRLEPEALFVSREALLIAGIPAFVMKPEDKTQVVSVEADKWIAPRGGRLDAILNAKHSIADGVAPSRNGANLADLNVMTPLPATGGTAAAGRQ